MANEKYIKKGKAWFKEKGWKAFPFQLQAWEAILEGKHGLVNAPTGSGKTYSLFVPLLLDHLREVDQNKKKPKKGLKAIWITPLRALAKEIQIAGQRAVDGMGLDWKVEIRTGDTSSSVKSRQFRSPPEVLITTPESLHVLLARKKYPDFFSQLKTIVVDEWHELMGSKRGVQMELGLSRLKGLNPQLKVWGISATIGNMDQAIEALLGSSFETGKYEIIRSADNKKIEVETIFPDEIETYPWSGHLGIALLDKVVPLIKKSQSTLIFTNTRAQCEIWYQKLLEVEPDLAGIMAMHHSSISRDLRDWVEEALHDGRLKAVVCTSSLDLGVDFRPVETIVQIGSPKGVARFMQRAGRSGHQPGAVSKIHFVPTHSLEIIEGAALRTSVERRTIESRIPYILSFDVLIQYLVTLAISEGFYPDEIYPEIKETFAYKYIRDEEWIWLLDFITTGGNALYAYDEYKKVEVEEGGKFIVTDKGIARRHRLSMGTIVSDVAITVKFVRGGRIGTIEEYFISQLSPGDTFWFAGRALELVRVREMTAQVRKSKKKTGKVPAWLGGRLSFTSELSDMLREKMQVYADQDYSDPEINALRPLLDLQHYESLVPSENEFLIEYFQDREGYHLLMYPFEGRYVHEGMSALIAWRISQIKSLSFSIAMNDYGFELLSDKEIPINEALDEGVLSLDNLSKDIQASVNSVEMAKRRFRDIASISGLIFRGFPGKEMKSKHLQSSSQLFFQVFTDYEPNNLLLRQAYDEVMNFQLEESRLRKALERINEQEIRLAMTDRPTPFSFPIITDRLRERLSSEKLQDRIRRMKLKLQR